MAVYAPSTYQASSSLTHLNEATLPDALMSPFLNNGQIVRQPTVLEWQIMKDLGWTINFITKTWNNGGGDSQWGSSMNWNVSGVPDATHDVYFTNSGIAANGTIMLGGDRSVNSLNFDTTTSFTIDGSAGSLTIASGFIGRTTQSSGSQTITRPIVLGQQMPYSISPDRAM